MTPTILRNLVSGRATRNYPAEVRDPFPLARGELINEIEKCIFCSMCERKCPSQCIAVDKDSGTWECDPFACVYCGVCVENCPVHCLHQKTVHRHVSPEPERIVLKGTPPKPKKKAPAAEAQDKDAGEKTAPASKAKAKESATSASSAKAGKSSKSAKAGKAKGSTKAKADKKD